jgi:hypothetical protein
MKLQAKCPKCANVMQFDESDADKRKRCLRCRRMFKVPEPQTMTDAMKVVENAQVGLFVDEQGNTYA